MKKKYISPKVHAFTVQAKQLMATSEPGLNDGPATSDALSNEDFGWGDDDPASWNWNK